MAIDEHVIDGIKTGCLAAVGATLGVVYGTMVNINSYSIEQYAAERGISTTQIDYSVMRAYNAEQNHKQREILTEAMVALPIFCVGAGASGLIIRKLLS